MKFSASFSNLSGIKCTKSYIDLFKFDIFIVRCLGGYFFPDTMYIYFATVMRFLLASLVVFSYK